MNLVDAQGSKSPGRVTQARAKEGRREGRKEREGGAAKEKKERHPKGCRKTSGFIVSVNKSIFKKHVVL